MAIKDRQFVCFWHFVGWCDISFGITFCLVGFHVEVHLPFGFIRVGWEGVEQLTDREKGITKRTFGKKYN